MKETLIGFDARLSTVNKPLQRFTIDPDMSGGFKDRLFDVLIQRGVVPGEVIDVVGVNKPLWRNLQELEITLSGLIDAKFAFDFLAFTVLDISEFLSLRTLSQETQLKYGECSPSRLSSKWQFLGYDVAGFLESLIVNDQLKQLNSWLRKKAIYLNSNNLFSSSEDASSFAKFANSQQGTAFQVIPYGLYLIKSTANEP